MRNRNTVRKALVPLLLQQKLTIWFRCKIPNVFRLCKIRQKMRHTWRRMTKQKLHSVNNKLAKILNKQITVITKSQNRITMSIDCAYNCRCIYQATGYACIHYTAQKKNRTVTQKRLLPTQNVIDKSIIRSIPEVITLVVCSAGSCNKRNNFFLSF